MLNQVKIYILHESKSYIIIIDPISACSWIEEFL